MQARATLSFLCLFAPLAMPAPVVAALRFGDCDRSWQCATLRVPLDHSGGRPGSIDLHVERVRHEGNKTGALDLRTPLSWAEEVAGLFPRATLVTDAVGHSVLFASDCASAAVEAFFANEDPDRAGPQGPDRGRVHPVRS